MTTESSFSAATTAWQSAGNFVQVDEHRVFIHRRGVGESVLFIHGFPTSCFDWRNTVAGLANRFDCIAFDQVGYGLSDKPEAWGYSLFQQADVVEALLKQLGVTAVHVVSHDVGTSVHAELLARKKEGRLSFAIHSSTLLNGSILKGMATLTATQKTLENPATLEEGKRMMANFASGYVEHLKRYMGKAEAISAEDAQVMTELLVHKNGNLRIPNIYSYVRERYLHTDRWVGAIQTEGARVQFLWGDADPIANIAMGRALHALMPDAQYLELPGIGHFVPIEIPETVAAHVSRFVAECSTARDLPQALNSHS
ncbi:alpha/beta fold hydrolase [Paraburkholderia diazotrophica]|uniref:Pimeloyl-ACP methyl ester carboxylesterase n=1 Tax=Paraburkholderia diazotrophica TaxID=667676 RepID=A0A1H7ECZ1_9BURK|nr:alpha/beta hydrolase [Paraburkholderia diazotrophica]SEK11781.1 Pimeloyl-ACP methyl ester carboxylesterase [Paraburkholderia diazotrophica]